MVWSLHGDVGVAGKADLTCGTSLGCQETDLPQSAFDALHRGDVKNVVAVSLFAVGGAVAATGVVLLILNQPRAVVAPVVGPGLIGLSPSLP